MERHINKKLRKTHSMKKSLFTLAIAGALLLGFNNCQAKTEKTTDNPAETARDKLS